VNSWNIHVVFLVMGAQGAGAIQNKDGTGCGAESVRGITANL